MRIKERDSASHRVPKCARQRWSTIASASFTLLTLLGTLSAQKDPGRARAQRARAVLTRR